MNPENAYRAALAMRRCCKSREEKGEYGMDQIKIGKYIAEKRKQKGLTQKYS